jgi:16S rRNA A1518/A1519 N6-dimethyltransferase RsmA/KsgA/DIM1 with predicted DNA glycosylase/AP lyase activity
VGERLAAPPGSKVYGAPSVKAAWYGPWRLAGTVSRQVFWPVPNVDSVLVGFRRDLEPRGDEALRRATFQVVDAAFQQRRKMLRQALAPVLGGSSSTASAVLEAAGVDPTGAWRAAHDRGLRRDRPHASVSTGARAGPRRDPLTVGRRHVASCSPRGHETCL